MEITASVPKFDMGVGGGGAGVAKQQRRRYILATRSLGSVISNIITSRTTADLLHCTR